MVVISDELTKCSYEGVNLRQCMSFKHFKHPLFATEMLNLNDCRDAAMLVLFRDISYGILCSNQWCFGIR